MIRNVLVLIFVLSTTLGFSQIVVTNAVFPEVGDSLLTATDNIPDASISLGVAGPDQFWNYTALTAPFSTVSRFLDPSEGMNANLFPDATLMTNDMGQGESYLQTTADRMNFLGFIGGDPTGLGLNLQAVYDPSQAVRFAPMSYGDNFTDTYQLVLPFAAEELPQFILDALPIQPDSLRLTIDGEQEVEADAWGSMEIPMGTYEVLRVKSTDISTTKIEAKFGFLPWSDITAIVQGLFPLGGADTTASYYFINDTSLELIADVSLDSLGNPGQVTFKTDELIISDVRNVNFTKVDVIAYPNPAIDDLRIEITNIPSGAYKLKFYNILGMEIDSVPFDHDGSKVMTVQTDVSEFRKGTFLYSLINSQGKTLRTKRIVVIRP